MNPINEMTRKLTDEMIGASVSKIPMEEKLDVMAMSPMFTFWEEIRTVMLEASEEIKVLKKRISELENGNEG